MFHARPDYQQRIIDKDDLIPADEPVFLLRAQDMHAEMALRYYAELIRSDENVPAGFLYSLLTHADRFHHWPQKASPDVPDIVS